MSRVIPERESEGPRRARLVKISKALPLLGLSVVGLLGGAWFFLATGEDPDHREIPSVNRPAQAGGDAYAFDDVQVQYPAVDVDGNPDPSKAVVNYVAKWVSDSYPGQVPCEFVLRNDAGQQVGHYTFELSSTVPVSQRAATEPITVSTPPTTASGTCGARTLVTPGEYEFGTPTVKEYVNPATGVLEAGRAEISFPVRWKQGEDPGIQKCTIHLDLRDGSTRSLGPFDVQLPAGIEWVTTPAVSPRSVRSASISCVR